MRVTLSRAVPSSSAIFGLDHDLGIEFVGNDEVGSLVEAGHLLSTLGLASGDARPRENVFDDGFHHVTDQLGNPRWTPKTGH